MSLRFIIKQKDFHEAVNSLQNISSKKGTLSIISNLLVESVQDGIMITGTDLEVASRIFVSGQVEEEGKLTLPSKKLCEILRESGSETLFFEEKDNFWVNIRSGLSTYNLAGMPFEEFPEFPDYSYDGFITLQSNFFLDLIEKCVFSIANDQENVYSLTSALFEKEHEDGKNFLKMITSDGHRLTIIKNEVSADLSNLQLNEITLIPKKGLVEWKKFCEQRDSIDFSFQEKQLVVKDENAVLIIRLKSGEFPNYRAIIEAVEQNNYFRVKRVPFLNSLKRISIFTEDIFHTIQLSIGGKSMILSSQNSELGNAKDEIEIEYDGDSLMLGFNCRYFIETLQVMEGEFVDVFINSNNSPCLMKSDDDIGFLSIIMPMQL